MDLTTKLEIERKYLLKSIPKTKKDKVVKSIEQYYLTLEDGRTGRIRKSTMLGKSEYYLTIKQKKGEGVYLEEEGLITKQEYIDFLSKAKKGLKKKRILIQDDVGLIWEVDVFKGMRLVIAEVELPSEDYKVEIPNFIQKVLIKDVTGIKEFSNSSLATKNIVK